MKRVTVTVGISAYNEEANVAQLLVQVLRQKQDGFDLEKVILISDGSIDRTVARAGSVVSSKIEILSHKKRVGKAVRLNELFKRAKSDIIVVLDCDIRLGSEDAFARLVKKFNETKSIGMVGALAVPFDGVTLTQRAINLTCYAYLEAALNLRNGNNLFSVSGRMLAYRRELARKIVIPAGMIGIDAYTYFSCLKEGFEFKLVRSCKVYYRTPMTLREHISQNTRFIARDFVMNRYFPKALVVNELRMPLDVIFIPIFKQFLKNPILSMYILVVNIYCRLRAYLGAAEIRGKWNIATSTKFIAGLNQITR